VAGLYSDGRPDAKTLFKKVASFPPFLALVLALALIPMDYPAWLELTLQRLNATLAPLALVSVGIQLKLEAFEGNKSALCRAWIQALAGAAYADIGLWRRNGATGQVIRITLFEAAMAPMIGGAIVAMQHRLNPALSTLMIGVGIPLSFLTLPGWWYLLRLV
jgi:malate permease and related proteins